MGKKSRDVQIIFRVTPEEKELIEAKMAQYGATSMASYLRKMAIDGYIINLDLPELRTISSLLLRTSSNINQIAKRANQTHRIYDTDLQEIQNRQAELIEGVGNILTSLSTLR